MAGDDTTVLSCGKSSVQEKANGMFHSFSSNERQGKNVGFEDENEALLRTPPIADLFAHATVMFADICGFTAWSRYVLAPFVLLASLLYFSVVSIPF
jgi:hypothetical protein